MSRVVVVDIGSRVARGLDVEKQTEIFKFEHTLGHSLGALTDVDDHVKLLNGRKFETFVRKIVGPLNRHHKKFGIDGLFVVATGDFQQFNKTHPGIFSCAVYANSIEKGTVPIFPLIYRDETDLNPQTEYAMVMESALLSEKSKSSLAIRGLSANVLALRGSGISGIQIDGQIQLAPNSMPTEYRYDIRVSGADRLPTKKSLKAIVGYYAEQISQTSIKNLTIKPATIIVGKGARDILEFKLDIKIETFKYYLSLDFITITKEQALELYHNATKQIVSRDLNRVDKKKLYRIRNTLAFIVALLDHSEIEQVILSDAKFSVGLMQLQSFRNKNFQETMARLGVSGFYDTFLTYPTPEPTKSSSGPVVKKMTKIEKFTKDVLGAILQIQHILDANGIDLKAADLFQANSYPYISDELKQSLIAEQ